MARDGAAVDRDAAAAERLLEGCGGKLGGVIDGQIGMEASGGTVPQARTIGLPGRRSRPGLAAFAWRRGRHGVVEGVVVHIRESTRRWLCRAIGRIGRLRVSSIVFSLKVSAETGAP